MNDKRILTVQDLSCLGHCSALVALPVLSAWGHETCLLPTALLSTHTAFGDPYILQLYGSMPEIVRHWQREKLTFDAILIGYLGSVRAIRQVAALVDTLLAPGGSCILDPVMADHGKLYRGFDGAYVSAMKELCGRADVLLPNPTEAALLAEFFCREPLYLKKGMEDTLYAKFLFNVIIRRLVACRLRLRNEYFLYHRIL